MCFTNQVTLKLKPGRFIRPQNQKPQHPVGLNQKRIRKKKKINGHPELSLPHARTSRTKVMLIDVHRELRSFMLFLYFHTIFSVMDYCLNKHLYVWALEC